MSGRKGSGAGGAKAGGAKAAGAKARRAQASSSGGNDASGDAAPDPRLYLLNGAPVQSHGAYVLYWLRAYRRPSDNLALDHAVARANALGLPLLVYEALDPRYPHASDRLHAFVLEGACEMRAALAARGAAYAFYLPRTRAEARASHAVARLAARAALVVTDWYPPVGGPASLWARSAAFAATLPCRVEAYDDAAIVPLAPLAHRHEVAARTIRPRVAALLEPALAAPAPREQPVKARAPRELEWPFAPTVVTPDAIPALLAACEIDHAVPPVAGTPGGGDAARARLERFVRRALRTYGEERNDMARVGSSQLSPYLHFGHISPRAVARAVRESAAPAAQREAFIEELAVRRALAFNHAMTEPAGHAAYDTAVPAWARATLAEHASDPRVANHTLAEWEAARTADPLWNAAQRELVRDGVIHPYARMLWGKVALTLCARPADAFAWLVHLNDKYALDGRDPNTYTNIAWCFGLHDHPYPARAVFGTVRSMTSRAAATKWDVREYLTRTGGREEDLEALRPPRTPRSPSPAAPAPRARTSAPARDELDQRPPWDD